MGSSCLSRTVFKARSQRRSCAATLWVGRHVVGRRLSAILSETRSDLIMNLTAREYEFSVLIITAAWRACLAVVTNDSVAIHHTAGAEPFGTIGIWMCIGRAAGVLVGRLPLTVSVRLTVTCAGSTCDLT